MEARTGSHPSADALQAFGLGKLDDASAETIVRHLDTCTDCRQAVAALSGDDFLQRLRRAQDRSSTPPPANALSAAVRAGKPAADPTPGVPAELAKSGQYEVLRELGRGGMGVVYLARNKLMDRLEVLKVINKALLTRPGAAERFLREIRAAAKLTHANVVTAYSAVQQGELLAFAMEYVEGKDLASLVKTQGPLPIAHACFYAQQAAWGLQHAHEKHMVHRDIKPQNLILARDGPKHIVKILDFGLAKAARDKGDNLALTRVGQMLGTPDYIAPEQSLDAARADIRADIYSLGCTLYFMLSGRPPFSANGIAALLLAHQMDEATPLNLVRKEVPEELATVVSKLMAKEPDKRYQTPSDVANALSGFLKSPATRQPDSTSVSQVEPMAKVKQLSKGPRIDPVAPDLPKAATPNPASPFAFDTVVVPVTDSGEMRTARKQSADLKGSYQRLSRMLLACGGIATGVVIVAIAGLLVFLSGGTLLVPTPDGIIVLKDVPPGSDVTVDGNRVPLNTHNGKAIEISVAPGKPHHLQVKKEGFKPWEKNVEVAAGERSPPIPVGLEPRASSPEPPPALPSNPATPAKASAAAYDLTGGRRFVHFDPDGPRVVLTYNDVQKKMYVVRVYNLLTNQPIGRPIYHDGWVNTAWLSPDGKRVVTGGDDGKRDGKGVLTGGRTRVWDVETSQPLTPLLEHKWVFYATFSPDGKRVVTTAFDGSTRIWNAETGHAQTSLLMACKGPGLTSFSPDSKRVITPNYEGTQVWDAQTGALLQDEKPGAACGFFSPDGARVLTGSAGAARFWNAHTGEFIPPLLIHDGVTVLHASFSPDGTRVVTASGDYAKSPKEPRAQVWDAQTGRTITPPLKHERNVVHASFSLDGKRIVTASQDKTVRIWDAISGIPLTAPLAHDGAVCWAAFSPDGKFLVTASSNTAPNLSHYTAHLWDAQTARELKKVTIAPD